MPVLLASSYHLQPSKISPKPGISQIITMKILQGRHVTTAVPWPSLPSAKGSYPLLGCGQGPVALLQLCPLVLAGKETLWVTPSLEATAFLMWCSERSVIDPNSSKPPSAGAQTLRRRVKQHCPPPCMFIYN